MTRSILTRHVFHQILRNEPIRHAAPRRPRGLAFPPKTASFQRARIQRRTLWFMPTTKTRYLKPREISPGLDRLHQIQERLNLQLRPPPVDEAVKALRDFFRYKRENRAMVLDTEVRPALAAFEYVQAQGTEEIILKNEEGMVSPRLLQNLIPAENTKDLDPFVKLADLVLADCLKKTKCAFDQAVRHDKNLFHTAYFYYFKILAQCGQGKKARAIVEDQLKRGNSSVNDDRFWLPVLKAFARSGDHDEIQKTIESMRHHRYRYKRLCQLCILRQFAAQRDVEGFKRWYEMPLDAGQPPSIAAHILVLKICLATKEFTYGSRISESIALDELEKAQWDVVFRWAAALGKGVDEIERLMRLMTNTTKTSKLESRPDIDSINGMLKDANERGDAYFAERLLGLAAKWDLKPNPQTLMLQIEYRLRVDDVDGARTTYQALRLFELLAQEDVPILNMLLFKLCQAKEPDEDAIASLIQDMQDRKGSFQPEPLTALCVYHLRRHEFHDAIDLLNSNVFQYQSDQRAIVRDALLSFIFDDSNSVDDAWDAYCILKETFDDEVDRSVRMRIMNLLFERGSAGSAVHVFGHMRQSAVQEKRPEAATYAACFRGIARAQDVESLNTVFNMLKLDSGVEPTTELNNALMAAQFECGSPRRALHVWDAIVLSREGPTSESVIIALQACQFAPTGDEYVQPIWARRKELKIAITKEMYDTYVLALAACNLVSEAIAAVEAMKSPLTPDSAT